MFVQYTCTTNGGGDDLCDLSFIWVDSELASRNFSILINGERPLAWLRSPWISEWSFFMVTSHREGEMILIMLSAGGEKALV